MATINGTTAYNSHKAGWVEGPLNPTLLARIL